MSTSNYFFSGVTMWPKIVTPTQFDAYEVPLYLDDESFVAFKESGCSLKVTEDEHGKNRVRFKRNVSEYNGATKEDVTNGPPPLRLLNKETGNYEEYPDGVLLGNGSRITCRVEIFDTPRRGEGTKGHRLVSIGVDELIPYEPEESEEQQDFPF